MRIEGTSLSCPVDPHAQLGGSNHPHSDIHYIVDIAKLQELVAYLSWSVHLTIIWS
jgi:hypothetical protein